MIYTFHLSTTTTPLRRANALSNAPFYAANMPAEVSRRSANSCRVMPRGWDAVIDTTLLSHHRAPEPYRQRIILIP